MDTDKGDRPERRTALVARELGRYNVHIAALSETWLPNEGQLEESKGGYTFFWSGRRTEDRRESGVGFAIKSSLVKNLPTLPKGISDRLMTLRLPIRGNHFATVISAYAPTLTNPEETKDKFYEDLESAIESVPTKDKLIVLRDFNARVGSDLGWSNRKVWCRKMQQQWPLTFEGLCLVRPFDHQHSLSPTSQKSNFLDAPS